MSSPGQKRKPALTDELKRDETIFKKAKVNHCPASADDNSERGAPVAVEDPKESIPAGSNVDATTNGNRKLPVGTILQQDSDLEGPLKKFTQGSIPYKTVLLFKLRDWDGLSFSAIARVYPQMVVTQGGDYSQQAGSKHYKTKKDAFWKEFPEAVRWRELRKEQEGQRRENGTDVVGANKSCAEDASIPPQLPEESPEVIKFRGVLDDFRYLLTMKSLDGRWFTCLVPYDALPHRTSEAGELLREEYGSLKIDSGQTSREALERYAQWVALSLTSFPTHDFAFEVRNSRPHNFAQTGRLTSSPIMWTARAQTEIYVLASWFGNDKVCDMIVDNWRNEYAEGNIRMHKEDLAYIERHTEDTHPVQKFWKHVLAAAGTESVCLEGDCKLSKERAQSNSNTLEQATKRLRDFDETEWCNMYHLHPRFKEDCYRKASHKRTCDPCWAEIWEMEDRLEEWEDKYLSYFETETELKVLTDADIEDFKSRRGAMKRSLEEKIPLVGSRKLRNL